jgi:hypothetical protein
MRKPNSSKNRSATPIVIIENEDATPETKNTFWLLKTAIAKKIGKLAEGGIGYQILSNADRQDLLICITSNSGGGYFSRERVPFDKVEACLNSHTPDKPFPSKLFKSAFVGRSSNNAGFLAAILRAEDLLAPAPDSETQHIASGDWAEWKKSMLAESGTRIEIEINQPANKEHASDLALAPESPSETPALQPDQVEASEPQE